MSAPRFLPLQLKYRVVPWLMLLFWMFFILSFSSQPKERSAEFSTGVTVTVLRIVCPGFSALSEDEQGDLISALHNKIRKAAHMFLFAVFGALALTLSFSYLRTQNRAVGAALAFSFLFGAFDELHQMFIPGRGPQFSDVLVDFSGACIGAALLLITYKLIFPENACSFPETCI